ncbi:phosphotransferase enzyme family protein [Actinomadura roseirufa]|uniref:phosphotransferase enzyme family protein n=1 Tax=Actinomadura roseirufa TaxID=2094049 RepID=UPI0013F163F3|nr:phosphotransferase [Actinomadura roseirufa]
MDDARLLNEHSNAVVALPTARLLARVGTNPNALDRVTLSVAVTRWLAGRGYPCVQPAEVDPFLVDGRVVSVWLLLDDVVAEPPATGAELGRLLHQLHRQPAPPIPLRPLADPFESVEAAIRQHPDGVTAADRTWLRDQIEQLRHSWTEMDLALPVGLVHGDAHSNNLIRTTDRVILGDWDHVAHGPREWDLIQVHYMARRFGRHDPEELDAFAAEYEWDVREWPDAETLIRTREITGLSPYLRKAPKSRWDRDEAAYRISTARTGDKLAHWNSPQR